MMRPQRKKSDEKARRSSKSVKERKDKINTDNYLSANTPQRKRRKESISFMHSKSISKNKGNTSKHNHSKSKQYLTPSKENDDIYHLVHPKLNKKLVKTKQTEEVRPFIEAARQLISRNLAKQAAKVLQTSLLISPNSYQSKYFLGMCYLVSEQYIQALKLFKNQLLNHPKKNLFLLLAVCYKKLNDFDSALQLLNNCLSKYPKFYDGFVQRGRLYMRMHKFDKANHDFQQAILLNQHKWIAYVLKGDCLRKGNKYITAIKMYNKAQKIQKSSTIILRKTFCNIQLTQYDIALIEINKILSQQKNNPQFLFAKGLVYRKKQQYQEAFTYFSQSLNNSFSKQLSARCLYQMAKIRILQKDYYGALTVLSKANNQNFEHKELERLKVFCEGISCLMKENYDRSIGMLNTIPKQYGLTKSLTTLFYSCRAYGYMHLKRFEEARIDLLKIQKEQTLSIPNMYNKYICQGILSWNQRKCEQALAYFTKASKIISNKLEPLYYKAVTLIQFVNSIIPSDAIDKKKQYLLNALKIIKRQTKPSRKQSDLLLIKGLLQYYARDVKNAINDINTVINQRNLSAVALYLKGLILGERQMYDQAIQFFSNAIEMDELKQYPQLYLNRAKCHILLKDQKKAFNDLQQYVSCRMVSPDIHIWAAHFLFSIGAYEDAAKAYSNVNNISKNKQILRYRFFCYLASLNFTNALNDLYLMIGLDDDKHLKFDAKYIQILIKSIAATQKTGPKQGMQTFYETCIQNLKSIKKSFPTYGQIFTESDYKILKGVFYFHSQNHQKALSNLQKGYKIQIKEGKNYRRKDGFKQNIESNFNLALCHIMNNNLVKAISLLKQLLTKVEDQVAKQEINLFINQIQNQIKAQFTSPQKTNKMKTNKTEQLFPFLMNNRLCSLYPKISLPLIQKISTCLYFDIPQVPSPQIHIVFDEKILQTVNIHWIKMRPQAPWIQRGEDGYILTDHIQQRFEQAYSQSSSSASEKHQSFRIKQQQDCEQIKQVQSKEQFQEQKKHLPLDNKYRQQSNSQDEQSQDSAPPFNPKKWAEEMKLGKQFQQKFQRVINKKNR